MLCRVGSEEKTQKLQVGKKCILGYIRYQVGVPNALSDFIPN